MALLICSFVAGHPSVDWIALITSCTPSEAKAKVEEYKKRGCTCPILYPVGGNFRLLIDTFAQV